MKVFATDIDSVMLDFSAAVRYFFENKYGADSFPAGNPQWDIHTGYGVPKPAEMEMWKHVWDIPLLPCPGAREFVQALRREGYTIIGVSTRPPGDPQRAAHRDFGQLKLDDYVLLDKGESKAPTVLGLGSHYFIDDNLNNVWDVGAAGVRTFLLDQPWNQSLDIAPAYTRVHSLRETLDAVAPRCVYNWYDIGPALRLQQ